MITNFLTANGFKFGYLEMGSGPLVLALHGFPDTPQTFQAQMRDLAAAGYRVVAPYMRGYFPTEAPPDASYERAALAKDVLALIDALSDQPVILIGHDWGAAAAYNAAILAPEKIAKLITLAVPYSETWWSSLIINPAQQRRSWYIYFFLTSYAEEALNHNDLVFIEHLWQEWSPGWNYQREEIEPVKEILRKPASLTAALNYYRHSFNPPHQDSGLREIRKRYGEPINVPTLYLHGEQDGGIGVETTVGMEEWFQSGLIKHVIMGTGHFLHRERPNEVNSIILDFLKK